MIKLRVRDYCHECPSFEVDVEKPDTFIIADGDQITFGDTYVRCANEDRCLYVEQWVREHYD